MDNQPYDNVEFPVRRPQPTGTWPGAGHLHQSSATSKVTGYREKSGHSLDPVVETKEGGLVEEEMEEDEAEIPAVQDQRHQMKVADTPSSNVVAANAVSSSPKANHVTTATKSSASSTFPRGRATRSYSGSSNTSPKDKRTSYITEQPTSSLEPFTWSDFNPKSQTVLENAYIRHKRYYKFSDTILKQGNRMKVGVWDPLDKPGETLTYEQLLQGVLVDGEKLLLGGGWLYFRAIEFLEADGSKQIKQPIGEGRICLTSLRMLLLSADLSAGEVKRYTVIGDAKLMEYGDPSKFGGGGYKLELSKCNNLFFQNISLDCFENVELCAEVGNAEETKITQRKPSCCGLFACIGTGRCGITWESSPPMPVVINRRTIRLGVYMPPWRTPTVMVVHLHPKMALTTARDFVVTLQNYVPQMQYHHVSRVPTVL